jgi:hypothetical protein
VIYEGQLHKGCAERSRRRGWLTAPTQGRQDILRATILAFREPLAQLADDWARHPVALQPAEQLLLAGWELDTLQVSTHLGGQALPQKIHVPLPPPGRSLG